jgi:hypothetical protein
MPTAFVRKYPFNRLSGSQPTGVLTGLTLTTGDLAIISINWYSLTLGVPITDTIVVTDSNSNIWHKVPGTFLSQSGGGSAGFDPFGQQIWYSNITNGGVGITITATFPVNVNFPALAGVEASGASVPNQISSGQSASAAVSSGTIVSNDPAFIYGSLYDDNANGTGMGSGWTSLDNTFNNYMNGYRTVNGGGSVTIAANTNSVAASHFVASVVSFNAPSTFVPQAGAFLVGL